MTAAATVIAELVKTQAGLDLPVRLRAWDGSEAGPADAPVLVARSPRALRRILWRPGELGLARAYISGDLHLDSDLTDGLRRVRAAVRPKAPGAVLAAARPKAPGGGAPSGTAPSPGPAGTCTRCAASTCSRP